MLLLPGTLMMHRATGAASVALAATLAGSYTDVAAIAFNDDFYYATTGFFGSMVVRDTGTPANDYENSPRSSGTATKITNSASALKVVRQSDGYLDFAAHNLVLRSADVSNASWGKVGTAATPGASTLNLPAVNDRIQQTLTASQVMGRNVILSATLSGTVGATMTLTIDEDGTETNQQITLTATPTRYSVARSIGETPTTVRVWIERNTGDTATSVTVTAIQAEVSWHRTTPGPYVESTTAAIYTVPFEWDSAGEMIGARFEEARTNLALRCSDLTHAAWTATNMTTARTATGPNNRANFATTLTATASNATILQSITSASAARKSGCWIKRRTGTGNIDLTQDNGTTWTTVTVTASWTLVEVPTATVTNPIVGIRIVTNADAVDVCFFQHETVANIEAITSPIYTVGATVTRAVDNFITALTNFPTITSAATIYAHYKPLAQLRGASRVAFSVAATSTNSIFAGYRTGSLDDVQGQVTSGGGGTMIVTGGSINTTTGNKTMVAVALNDGEVVSGGVSLGTDVTTGVPSGAAPTHAVYGADGTGLSTPLNGWLIAALVVPIHETQANMITLTS